MSVEWGDLIPQIAHDIRSLVRKGLSNAQFLERHLGAAADRETSGYLRAVIESQVELNRLVMRLVALSDATTTHRKSSGAAEKTTDLEVAVLGAKLDCKDALQQAGAELIMKDLPSFTVPEKTQIVIRELIQNALRYADPSRSPRILIGAEANSERVRVRITDNGTGLPPGYEDRLFQPFQRLDSTRSGFGLGLVISREILVAAGGDIFFERSDPGATFIFELPARP